jgi:molybdopterin-guanine dinucleotide biosynthesis protein A
VAAAVTFDAIVLCGGASRRLDGNDKAAVEVGGETLLDRALAAVDSAAHVIGVGPARATSQQVTWTQEDPPGGGPVAAIAAGLAATTAEVVVVLGVDFPFVDRVRVDSLVGLMQRDGAILSDDTGKHQFLVGAYRRAAVVEALKGRAPDGMSVKELIAGLDLVVLEDPRSARDVDTWADVDAAVEELS